MHRPLSDVLRSLIRDAGAAVGVFGLVNVLGELVRGPFDVNPSFVGVPESLHATALPLEAMVAGVLVVHRVKPFQSARSRAAAAALLGLVAFFSAVDVVMFYRVVLSGAVRTSCPIPSSIVVCAFFTTIVFDVVRGYPKDPWTWKRSLQFATISCAVTAALPLLLMFTFGPTNYARQADCAVVFGAKVWDDGTPSLALSDRVDEGIRLYQKGFVKKLIMSGAIDNRNGYSEPEVMKKRALEAGLPISDILLDEAGVDTSSTVRNTAALMHREGFSRALAVSHYYHEPRVKMLFSRTRVHVYTVPAKMTRHLVKEPLFIVREILAYYHSWLLQ